MDGMLTNGSRHFRGLENKKHCIALAAVATTPAFFSNVHARTVLMHQFSTLASLFPFLNTWNHSNTKLDILIALFIILTLFPIWLPLAKFPQPSFLSHLLLPYQREANWCQD